MCAHMPHILIKVVVLSSWQSFSWCYFPSESQYLKCSAGPSRCRKYSMVPWAGPKNVRLRVRHVHLWAPWHLFWGTAKFRGEELFSSLSAVLFSLSNHRTFKKGSDFTGLGVLLKYIFEILSIVSIFKYSGISFHLSPATPSWLSTEETPRLLVVASDHCRQQQQTVFKGVLCPQLWKQLKWIDFTRWIY